MLYLSLEGFWKSIDSSLEINVSQILGVTRFFSQKMRRFKIWKYWKRIEWLKTFSESIPFLNHFQALFKLKSSVFSRKSELIRIKAGKALIQPSLFFHFSYFVDFVQFGKIPWTPREMLGRDWRGVRKRWWDGVGRNFIHFPLWKIVKPYHPHTPFQATWGRFWQSSFLFFSNIDVLVGNWWLTE